jgi:hypothetical protein
MKKTCNNCKHWDAPHDGMWESEEWGACGRLDRDDERNITALCEGCVSVCDRVSDLEYVTHSTFGCIYFANAKGDSR